MNVKLGLSKISPPFISTPLSYIFNKSMISGIFPTRLKYATTKPSFKNGDKKNVANYRPISILPSFWKILEKRMYIRLMNQLETNNILATEQFGLELHLPPYKLNLILLIIY
jgi:hypothetical protein